MEQIQAPASQLPVDFVRALSDGKLRKELASSSLEYFCLIYLGHYFPLEPADYFPDLLAALDDDELTRLLIIGFRGSAKSTFVSMAYVLYAALVKPHLYPFIVAIADTGTLASALISAVKYELESNELLRDDFGTIVFDRARDRSWEVKKELESKEEWQARNLLLSTGVRILARSRGQRIRGLRHRQHRPKLIIGDDIESLDSVNTQEKRDGTSKWWRGEVVGALARGARAILVGNWLHMDGLLARMKSTGRYKVLEFSLLREGYEPEVERVTWKAMYPTQEDIDKVRDDMGEIAFQREMLLRVVPDEGQDVVLEDIHYYDEQPFDDGNYLAHAVDPAISTKQSADPTAVVSGEIAWNGGQLGIYIQPNPVNKRMNFYDAMEELENIRRRVYHARVREVVDDGVAIPLRSNESVREEGGKRYIYASYVMNNEFFVENVAFQQVMIEEMERRAFNVTAVHPTKDKRARLRVASRYIKNGTVKFPRKGAEALIQQLLGFGIEKHDDLVDALVYLILGVVGDGISPPTVQWVDRE